MFGTHNDLKRLIEFSIEENAPAAIAEFPMFSAEQIQRLFDLTISQRIRLLHDWGSEDEGMSHFLRRFHDPHEAAQAEKIRQLAADPSN